MEKHGVSRDSLTGHPETPSYIHVRGGTEIRLVTLFSCSNITAGVAGDIMTRDTDGSPHIIQGTLDMYS